MVHARKRFGQHFLADQGVIHQIVNAMGLKSSDRLIEIGPGQGALTEHLAGQTDSFVAIEIDRDLVPFLKARFPAVEFINEDVLAVDLASLLHTDGSRLVGNLPYNISSPLLLKIATLMRDHRGLVRDGHFMLQREMAERMAAVPGTKAWGRLSIMMQLSCDVEHLFDVAPESFKPPPKVWSSVVRILPKDAPLLTDASQVAALDRVLRLAFAGRRKRLANALKTLDLDWGTTGVDPNVRADNVTLQEFVTLALIEHNEQ
ncbi:MAG: 16S rRNA (adenine(1518)-N(6)/adenine(1519)-N(6))-dimethyltransferase RsmA [Pseudomonadales bacterium]